MQTIDKRQYWCYNVDYWHLLRGGKREMFPSEMAMLMVIAVARDSGEKLLPRPMDVVGGYIGYLYDSLVSRGYLKRDSSREY